MGLMARRSDAHPRQLTVGEQRALAAFLAGRLPAGQLEFELARARDAQLVTASAAVAPPPAPLAMPAALRAA